MNGIRPILDLLRAPWLRFKRATLDPTAPADEHMRLMLALADLERAQ